ncbi:MAG: family transcriptional regulator [Glaciihabitans sp.]|nr:family transcriptional regulator [Glaciihabitans sp.]
MTSHSSAALGEILRAWRDRLSPADAGLSVGTARRAAGLRREELAQLAGLSVDYIVRLEQGRATNPSGQVVSALARALQLNQTERDHLYRSAGLQPPADGHISAHIPPGVQRMVTRLGETPLGIFTASWQLVSWNPLWAALHGDPQELPTAERNLLRAVFGSGPANASLRPATSTKGSETFAKALVADLRLAKSSYPTDRQLAALIIDLRRSSSRFEDYWTSGTVMTHESDLKTIQHPNVGSITLDCDVITVPCSDLRIIMYSAAAGTVDAGKLDFLRVTGVVSPVREFPHLPGR